MKRLTTIEKCAVALGLVLGVIGTLMIIHPYEGTVFHPGSGYDKGARIPNRPVNVSKTGSQIYGVIAIVLGMGISGLAFYRERK